MVREGGPGAPWWEAGAWYTTVREGEAGERGIPHTVARNMDIGGGGEEGGDRGRTGRGGEGEGRGHHGACFCFWG